MILYGFGFASVIIENGELCATMLDSALNLVRHQHRVWCWFGFRLLFTREVSEFGTVIRKAIFITLVLLQHPRPLFLFLSQYLVGSILSCFTRMWVWRQWELELDNSSDNSPDY